MTKEDVLKIAMSSEKAFVANAELSQRSKTIIETLRKSLTQAASDERVSYHAFLNMADGFAESVRVLAKSGDL